MCCRSSLFYDINGLTHVQIPVILVGNKIDLRGGEVTNEALEAEIIPIMNEFKVGRTS